MPLETRFFLGLSLGQTQDPTSLAVLEQRWPGEGKSHYHCRHLERFAAGTSYAAILARLRSLFAMAIPGMPPEPLYDSVMVIDGTGVGKAVVSLFRDAELPCRIVSVVITAGVKPSFNILWHLPKRELCGVLQILLQQQRLKIAAELDTAETLMHELMSFRARITPAASDDLADWRERPSDDLVLAIAIAAWQGEREPPEDGMFEPQPELDGVGPWYFRHQNLRTGFFDLDM